ncbi:MAG: hypothetical protein HFJ80_07860 [Clostridiales bacterium]|nr:hypothetical protein [Clostridiales bacterium]
MISLLIRLPLQKAVTIKTDCDSLAVSLFRQYGSYASNGAETADVVVWRKGAFYTIEYEGRSSCTDSPLGKIHHLLLERRRDNDQVIAFHGAAVEWRGKAIILLAATGAGKTTLTSYLTGKGMGYLTDDCVLVGRTEPIVYPFTTPLQLRAGGLEVLRRCGAAPADVTETGDPLLCRYVSTPAYCVSRPLPLSRIYFIQRDGGNEVEPMGTNEAMIHLLKAPITPYPLTGSYLRFMARLAGTGCRRLRYADMDYVAGVIRHG